MLYNRTIVREYRSNRNVLCAEHQAEIEELEVMPDHVQRYGQCGPAIRYSSAGEADQRAFIAALAPRISRLETEEARVSGRIVTIVIQ